MIYYLDFQMFSLLNNEDCYAFAFWITGFFDMLAYISNKTLNALEKQVNNSEAHKNLRWPLHSTPVFFANFFPYDISLVDL